MDNDRNVFLSGGDQGAFCVGQGAKGAEEHGGEGESTARCALVPSYSKEPVVALSVTTAAASPASTFLSLPLTTTTTFLSQPSPVEPPE